MQHTHVQKFHLIRLVLTGLLGVAVLVSRTELSAVPLVTPYRSNDVLAYATNMSVSDLLASANTSRAANGLAPLSLNSLLNSSAQSKAQHMVTNNYWAHVAPDGTQPWYFFSQAGYAYVAAGENLAYGFNTGSEVNTAWMNSPSHRANILGNYTEVGFGIASSATFQGGENTLVVAHYGLPPASATPSPTPVTTPTLQTTTPTPTPAAPTQEPAPTTTPTSNTSTTPTESPAPTSAESTPTSAEKPTSDKQTNDQAVTVQTASSTKTVSALEEIMSGKITIPLAVSLGLATFATTGFALTHRRFMAKLLEHGKKVAIHHPLIDITLIGAALAAILTMSVGRLL